MFCASKPLFIMDNIKGLDIHDHPSSSRLADIKIKNDYLIRLKINLISMIDRY